MDSYIYGVEIAFLVWLFHMVNMIVKLNSQLSKNLARIGSRLSWTTLKVVPIDRAFINESVAWKVGKFIAMTLFSLLFILGSWLYVVGIVGTIVYKLFNGMGAPQAVRDWRWKLRNMDMPFDQMVREMTKLQEAPVDYDDFRAGIVAELQERGLNPG